MLTGPADTIIRFKAFTDSLFPERPPLLNQSEFEQLSWRLGSPSASPEKAILDTNKDPAYLEAKRCLSRLYCLELLTQGADTYANFTAPQIREDPYLPVLTQMQYQVLCAPFIGMDLLTSQTLRVATLISSITLSPKAREKADEILGKDRYTIDTVEFLADTFRNINHARRIFPLVENLFMQYPQEADKNKITLFLQAAFASRCHYRHMLYTEGNQNMFAKLLANKQSGAFTREQFEFWKAYWTINITGFRGHLAHGGSIYLTSNTFRAMQALETSLTCIFTEPEITTVEILNAYLDKRAGPEFIDLQDCPQRVFEPNEKRLLAHIAAMMRLFSKDEGEALREGYILIPKSRIRKLAKSYFDTVEDEPTATYAPALFENGIDFRKQNYQSTDMVLKQIHDKFYGPNIKFLATKIIRLIAIADVVVALLPIHLEAMNHYRLLRTRGKIPLHQPLNFSALASKREVMSLCGESPIFKKFNILNHSQISVDEKGNALIRAKPKKSKGLITPIAPSPYFTPGWLCAMEMRARKQTTQKQTTESTPTVTLKA